MAEKLEREYIIPLRKEWLKASSFKRAKKAVRAVREFLARHMKVEFEDVKIGKFLNHHLWARGIKHPPHKVKVKAIKEGDTVKVQFAETPQYVTFLKLKHSKLHKKAEEKKEAKPEEIKSEAKPEEKKEEKTPDQKKDEAEKGKAVEQQNIKQADAQVKAQKHTSKVKEPKIQRMALKK